MKIAVSDGPLEPMAFPARKGLDLQGTVVSRPGLPPVGGGLGIWTHELCAGARVIAAEPDEDHVFYLLAGGLLVGDQAVDLHGAVCIARNAIATLEAGPKGARVIHYVGDAQSRPPKPGGCVHVLSDKGLLTVGGPRKVNTLYADSDCPTCSVWLHKQAGEADKFTLPHCHSTDEIINVLEGELILGTRTLGPGSSVAVAKDAYYSFRTGARGMTFLNFRQDDPYYLRKGLDPSKRKKERDMMWSKLDDPAYAAPAIQSG